MMGIMVVRMIQVALLLPIAASYPRYIGCNLQIMPTKLGAGRNVMTTTAAIMGATPKNDNTLVSASVVGSTVTLTFSGAFSMGIAHATIGTFNAPQFAGAPDANAATCIGTESIKYKDVSGTTNTIIWNAPVQKGSATSVTLSFAGASGYGTISRHTITLPLSSVPGTTASPNPGAGQATGSQYAKISSGTCASFQMTSINDLSTCAAAAKSLRITSPVIQTSAAPAPEGCHYNGNRVLLATNPANSGYGAIPGFEVICLISASSLDRFKLVKTGSCASNRMSAITDRPTCEVAAQVLQLADKTATNTSLTPRPEGCFYNTLNNRNELYLSVNPANAFFGAAPGYDILCSNTPSNVVGSSITDNKAIIGGIVGGALLLCLILGCCLYRYMSRTKHFEA